MYADISTKKTLQFLSIVALLFVSISVTIYAKKFVPPEYYSLNEGMRSLSLTLQSFRYNMIYAESKKEVSGSALLTPQEMLSAASSTNALSGNIARDIPVLVYHGIVTSTDRFSMTPKTFSDQ